MKYYFSSPMIEVLEPCGVERFLLAFSLEKSKIPKCTRFKDILIDSGAFSVWNSGRVIDVREYCDFCKGLPQTWHFVNLDVIPKTGSTAKQIERCVEQSLENYKFLRKSIRNVVPVYHYGEDVKWLKRWMDLTDYIGVSPANDIAEKVKQQFIEACFARWTPKFKYHGFGYSSQKGLIRFPFYSVDSISYQRGFISGTMLWLRNSHFRPAFRENIRKFLRMEKHMTELWASRGVKWTD